ncbi:MAG: PKD domain-containing protein [Bacteroidales bacterium]|nr:PKD domain-containing protein [Bacteroidales bacterium]
MKPNSIMVSLIISVILLTTGCNKDEENKASFPTLYTKTPLTITSNSAVVGGFISSDGGATITERGVCYSSVNQNPLVSDSVYKDGAGTGNYQFNLSDLDSETTYYLRAYALNSKGTGYGNPVSFTTEVEIIAPIAAFIATPVSGAKPLSVSFTDQSTNNPTSWFWDFGDGENSTQQNPGHIYAGIGTYNVQLTVTNSSGTDIEEKNSFIHVSLGSGTVTDIDGNVYETLEIGNQEWMIENLEVTHYRNGDSIPNETVWTQWGLLTTGAYCWYNNDINWKDPYGALYNWYAVVDSRGLCPAGWHTPSDAEWTVLTNYLGGEDEAGGKMKSTRKPPDAHPRWNLPNAGATNKSAFSVLPGGERPNNGVYSEFGSYGFLWSSVEFNSDYAWFRSMNCDNSKVTRLYTNKEKGRSVRCIRD